jgi:hypothetical protein
LPPRAASGSTSRTCRRSNTRGCAACVRSGTSTFSQIAPRWPPSFLSGTAPADGADTPERRPRLAGHDTPWHGFLLQTSTRRCSAIPRSAFPPAGTDSVRRPDLEGRLRSESRASSRRPTNGQGCSVPKTPITGDGCENRSGRTFRSVHNGKSASLPPADASSSAEQPLAALLKSAVGRARESPPAGWQGACRYGR